MDKINYIYWMKSYHTQKDITYEKAFHLRYMSANNKIEDKNGNLKMQINNKKPKTNRTTSPDLPSGKKPENV